MKKILFVCTGNTCRSPMAQAIFNDRAKSKNIDARADSAGVTAFEGAGITPNAEEALFQIGIDASSHLATRFRPDRAAEYDLIVAMTPAHAQMIESMAPELRGKIRVMGQGIPDPFGMDLDEYIACRDVISKETDLLLEELS